MKETSGTATRRAAAALAVVLCLCAWPASAAKQDPARLTDEQIQAMTPFGDVVKRNWERWSKGAPTVAKIDLIARIADPSFTGEDAAALVALEVWLRKHPPVDLAAAAAIDDGKIAGIYQKNVVKLQRAKRTLFANGRPTFELLQQGPPGDCYFFSASGWMARYRPEAIMKAITELPDGRFRVRFGNGDEATVTPPTDGELAINDSDSTLQDGLWMPVLEKAWGTVQSRTFSRSAAIPDPTVAIDTPGIPIASVVERWTGREAKKFPLGRRAHRENVRAGLVRMHDRNSLATALLLHRPPAKLAYDHVYAIMDFDVAANRVILWNPWGTDFTPEGPSGPDNGYERKRGIFTLSLDEFIDFYTFLAIEAN